MSEVTDKAPSPCGPVAKRECPKKSMKNCMGCRMLAGSGMLLASGYVFMAARRNLRGGGSTTIGTVAQMVFAAGLASLGTFVIVNPEKKCKNEKPPA
ncbi:DMAC1 protein, partial [Polypterus senegalus]